MGLKTITLIYMCCIWYDNGKHEETSIYSLRIRSSLISNEGFVLAKKWLDKSFLPGINIFSPCFFLKAILFAFCRLFIFFLILLRQQWPGLHTLWMRALIRKSTCYLCEMAELGREGVNPRGSIWALSKKQVLVQHCDTAPHTLLILRR